MDLAEVCGRTEPVRILALGDDEAVGPASDAIARFEDRWLVPVQQFDRAVVDVNVAHAYASRRVVPQLGARVESIDRCGGDRRVVAEGIDQIRAPRRDGEPWLGYRRDTEMVVRFDPDGAFEPQPLGYVRPFLWQIIDGPSVVLRRRDERDLVRFTFDGAVVQQDVLATNVAQTSSMPLYGDEPPLSILVLHDEGELVELSLETGQREPVLSGVRMFSHGVDPRWVAWTPGDPATSSDALPTEGWLLDRATGEQLALGSGEPMFVQIYRDHVMVQIYDGEEPLGTKRTTFISLPGAEAVTLEGRWLSFGGGPDGRVVIMPGWPWGPEAFVYAPMQGELRQIAGPVPTTTNTLDALWSRDPTPYADLDAGREAVPYDLVRFDLASLRSEVAQRRIWSEVELSSDLWVDVRGDDAGDPIGDLVIIDGADGSAHVLDRDVVAGLAAIEPEGHDVPHPKAADEVVYQVRDPGSDRTGLWRVAFGEP